MQPTDNEHDLFGAPSSGEDGISACEIWKTHPDHPGYDFSSWGRVYSHRKRRILKGNTERTKHIKLELVKRSPTEKRPQPTLHQLILEVFVGPCPPGKEIVCHINGNPRDNRVENLRWGTYQENSFDRHKHNGTSKGGSRSRAIKHTASGSTVRNPLRDALEEAVKDAGNNKTVNIPMDLAKGILAELSQT